ncbi:MAG: TnpV protein [Tenericutes bacterium]|nr:TnpV protein [Mycoplasmatota bacterium]
MKIKYIKQVDYLIPNLKVNEQKNINIGKYGLLRLNYLKQQNKSLYTTLLMEDKLTDHLISVDKECNDRFNLLMKQYKETDIRLSEKNKEVNQMKWIKLMNNYKNSAEEIILKENIYI